MNELTKTVMSIVLKPISFRIAQSGTAGRHIQDYEVGDEDKEAQ